MTSFIRLTGIANTVRQAGSHDRLFPDSSKDCLADGWLHWAQYQPRKRMTKKVAAEYDMRLTLFHGRGGTVGRGGGPAKPGRSFRTPAGIGQRQLFRITSRSEMIRFKFGMPDSCRAKSHALPTAVIEATTGAAAPTPRTVGEKP